MNAQQYNKLLLCIRMSLRDLIDGIQGARGLSEEAERLLVALNLNQVPAAWLAKSYRTLCGLQSFKADLKARVEFI